RHWCSSSFKSAAASAVWVRKRSDRLLSALPCHSRLRPVRPPSSEYQRILPSAAEPSCQHLVSALSHRRQARQELCFSIHQSPISTSPVGLWPQRTSAVGK